MKKVFLRGLVVAVTAGILLLSGCSLFNGDKESEPSITEPMVSPVINVSDDYYPGKLPYEPSQTRGMIHNVGTRVDMTRLELGLMEIAGDTFDRDQYLFQEGQIIEREDIEKWFEGTPNLLHVLEHDYLNRENGELAGTVIAISLSPVVTKQEETVTLTEDELRELGKNFAGQVIGAVRETEPDVPMVLSLYVTNPESSLIPGHFIAVGKVNSEEDSVSDWKNINEKYYLLPGDEIFEDHIRISRNYDQFQEEIQTFFSDYIGVVGVARFVQDRMVELTLTATAEYDSKTESLQFAQYAASLFPEYFDDQVHINLYVETIDRPMAIYVRPPAGQGDPFFHVYRK
ncbi:MAG: CamS family sex pheromone protein [Bacillaceae bacterium]|nr:CamS family sex pheromone protein [Bacillaceae bacterium]